MPRAIVHALLLVSPHPVLVWRKFEIVCTLQLSAEHSLYFWKVIGLPQIIWSRDLPYRSSPSHRRHLEFWAAVLWIVGAIAELMHINPVIIPENMA